MHCTTWLRELRQELHTLAEVSGHERETAARIAHYLQGLGPDKLFLNVGGNGVVAVFRGTESGPNLGIRAELDALPIYELSDIPYRSLNDGVAHLCGHDGHMSMVMGIAKSLSEQRPKSGSVALIFQPAEETGQGAHALRNDSRFENLQLDHIFSLHNVPGLEIGAIQIPTEDANCASRGVKIVLEGQTSHAAAPQDGLSPMQTISSLMPALEGLSNSVGGVRSSDFSLITITHATLGKPTFGIAPGYAEIWATLRTRSDDTMGSLCEAVENIVKTSANEVGLEFRFSYHEVFDASQNNSETVSILEDALSLSQIPFEKTKQPQLWSEDFGQYAQGAKTAMFWLGSGVDQPQLHTPTYDFPDELLPVGLAAFMAVIHAQLG